MEYRTVIKWIGLIASLLCTMLSGLFLSFNVYAVQLKTRLDLSQTQVELLGSFTIAGLSVAFVGHFIIEKFGYRACYVIAWAMLTLSSVLMWLATMHPTFFRDWMVLLCLFQFMNTVGGCLTELCCIAIAVTLFGKRHIGKVTGVYLAIVSFGKIYYGALYQIFFITEEHLGEFFLSIPVGFTLTMLPCLLFHTPVTDIEEDDNERVSLKDKEVRLGVDEQSNASECNARSQKSLRPLLTSGFFHLFLWSNGLFNGCSTSFMNNITGMGHDIGVEEREVTVYALAAGMMISRFVFGASFDCFGTQTAGMWLLVFCYVVFMAAMIIGRFWLNQITIYLMIGLAALGIGPSFSLGLAVLTSEFGVHYYSFLIGMLELGVTASTVLVQVIIGLTYDRVSSQRQTFLLCNDCFDWTFVLLFFVSGISLICIWVLIFGPKCTRKGNYIK